MNEEAENPSAVEEQSNIETPETAENVEDTDESIEEETQEDGFESKFNEMNDKFLRLYSEFENFRRRTAKERIELLSNAKGESLKGLLPVVDDFERAILNNEKTEEVAPLKEGFGLIHHKLIHILEQSGMKPMDTKAGDAFDTDLHEAVTQIPAPSDDLKGKIVDVIEKGYIINEKVVRYAKVVIGS